MSHNRIKFLVCINGNKNSETLLKVACKKAKSMNAEILILNAIEVDQHAFLSVTDAVRQEKKAETEEMINEILSKVDECANISIQHNITEGTATEVIIKAIEEDSSIRMVVLGAPQKASQSIIPALLAKLDTRIMIPLMIVPATLTDQQMMGLEQ